MPKRNPTKSQFKAALRDHETSTQLMWANERLARRAAFAAFWFIENVTEDDPARTDLFFKVREIMRDANL